MFSALVPDICGATQRGDAEIFATISFANLPYAGKLVAFGELAFVKVGKGGTQASMNDGSSRFDDDGDGVVVAVTEPVKWHR